jgi:hypothetical protein
MEHMPAFKVKLSRSMFITAIAINNIRGEIFLRRFDPHTCSGIHRSGVGHSPPATAALPGQFIVLYVLIDFEKRDSKLVGFVLRRRRALLSHMAFVVNASFKYINYIFVLDVKKLDL